MLRERSFQFLLRQTSHSDPKRTATAGKEQEHDMSFTQRNVQALTLCWSFKRRKSAVVLLACQTIFCNPLQFVPSFRSAVGQSQSPVASRSGAIGKLLSSEGKERRERKKDIVSVVSLPVLALAHSPSALTPPSPGYAGELSCRRMMEQLFRKSPSRFGSLLYL